MGFCELWIDLIFRHISSNWYSLLVNGSRYGFFQSNRGLRQGDPLSPFLFLIAMEGLNHMFRKAKTNEWVRGFSALAGRGEELEITHLFYANDALIFCEAEEA